MNRGTEGDNPGPLADLTLLSELVRLMNLGHVQPPMYGVVEAWLWYDDADSIDREPRMLYEAQPEIAAAMQRALGRRGVFDHLYPDEAAAIAHETEASA